MVYDNLVKNMLSQILKYFYVDYTNYSLADVSFV